MSTSAEINQETVSQDDVLDLLDGVEAIEVTQTETQEALDEVDASVDKEELLKQEVLNAKTQIKEALKIGGIKEVDIIDELSKLLDKHEVSQDKLPEYLAMLGMKNAESAEVFLGADENASLDEDEMVLEETDVQDESETSLEEDLENASPAPELNDVVESVFREFFTELKDTTDKEGVRTFMREEWGRVRTLLLEKYGMQPAQEDKTLGEIKEENTPSFSGQTPKKQQEAGVLGLLKSFVSSEVSKKTPLGKFYDAINGLADSEEVFLKDGKLDIASLDIAIYNDIDKICDKIEEGTIERYKDKTRALDIENNIQDKEVARQERKEKLATVPAEHSGWSFEKKYRNYVDNEYKNGGRPKDFDEWMKERPKPKGWFGNLIESIKLFIINAGIGKFIRDWLGDTFIGGFLGFSKAEQAEIEAEKAAEKQAELDEAEAKETQKAQESLVETLVSEKSNPLWEGVSISGVSKDQAVLNNLPPADVVFLDAVLHASPQSVLGVSRTKGFSLQSLKYIKEMEERGGLVYESDATTGGRVKVNDGKDEEVKDDADIKEIYDKFNQDESTRKVTEEAANKKEEGDRLNRLKLELGKDSEYAEYFNLKNDFPKELINRGRIEKTLKSLLKLLKRHPDFVQGYKITDEDLSNFILGKTLKKFDTSDNTFTKTTGNDYFKPGNVEYSVPDLPGVPLPSWAGGSKGTIGSGDKPIIEVEESWATNNYFENVQAFFDWLENQV